MPTRINTVDIAITALGRYRLILSLKRNLVLNGLRLQARYGRPGRTIKDGVPITST
jgi:hypothetical protein